MWGFKKRTIIERKASPMSKIESQTPLEDLSLSKIAPIKSSVLDIGRAFNLILFFTSLLLPPIFAFAQDQAEAYIDPNLGGPVANVGQFVAALIDKYAVPFAVVAALLIIVYAGFEYITSGGAPEALTKSKELIIGAVFGLLTVFLIGWFLQSIIPGDELKDTGGATSSSGAKVSTAPDPNTDLIGYLNYENAQLAQRVNSAGKNIDPRLAKSFDTESKAIVELTGKINVANSVKLTTEQKRTEMSKLELTIKKLMGIIKSESVTQQKLLRGVTN